MNFLVKGSHILFLLSFLLIIVACSQSKDITAQTETNSNFELLAKEKFSENYVMEFNSSKSYMLCFKNVDHKMKNSFASAYFIYDLKNDVVLFEETIGVGSVKWLNDNQVEISPVPGIVKGGEKEEDMKVSYIYDITLKKKLTSTIDKNN